MDSSLTNDKLNFLHQLLDKELEGLKDKQQDESNDYKDCQKMANMQPDSSLNGSKRIYSSSNSKSKSRNQTPDRGKIRKDNPNLNYYNKEDSEAPISSNSYHRYATATTASNPLNRTNESIIDSKNTRMQSQLMDLQSKILNLEKKITSIHSPVHNSLPISQKNTKKPDYHNHQTQQQSSRGVFGEDNQEDRIQSAGSNLDKYNIRTQIQDNTTDSSSPPLQMFNKQNLQQLQHQKQILQQQVQQINVVNQTYSSSSPNGNANQIFYQEPSQEYNEQLQQSNQDKVLSFQEQFQQFNSSNKKSNNSLSRLSITSESDSPDHSKSPSQSLQKESNSKANKSNKKTRLKSSSPSTQSLAKQKKASNESRVNKFKLERSIEDAESKLEHSKASLKRSCSKHSSNFSQVGGGVVNRRQSVDANCSANEVSNSMNDKTKKHKTTNKHQDSSSFHRDTQKEGNTSHSPGSILQQKKKQLKTNRSMKRQRDSSLGYPSSAGKHQELGVLNRKIAQLQKQHQNDTTILVKERQRTNDLLEQIKKLKRKIRKMKLAVDKNEQLASDYQRLMESFEKSEYIRNQQKLLITNLKFEISQLKGEKGNLVDSNNKSHSKSKSRSKSKQKKKFFSKCSERPSSNCLKQYHPDQQQHPEISKQQIKKFNAKKSQLN